MLKLASFSPIGSRVSVDSSDFLRERGVNGPSIMGPRDLLYNSVDIPFFRLEDSSLRNKVTRILSLGAAQLDLCKVKTLFTCVKPS